MPAKEHFNAAQSWISFIHAYVTLLDLQITAIKGAMAETVTGCMDLIRAITDSIEEQKRKADEALLANQATTIAALNSADDARQKSNEEKVSDRMRRFSGKFSKSIEAITNVDESLGGILLAMIGSLSSEDVIVQRLEHIAQGVGILREEFPQFVKKSANGLTQVEVDEFRSLVLFRLYSLYTMEDEKRAFKQFFPDFVYQRAS